MPKPRTSTGEKNLISKRLIKLREKHNMSQRLLAYQLQLNGYDMDKNVITRIETNKRYVTDVELKALSEIFHVSYDYLIDGKEDIIFDTSALLPAENLINPLPKYAALPLKMQKRFWSRHPPVPTHYCAAPTHLLLARLRIFITAFTAHTAHRLGNSGLHHNFTYCLYFLFFSQSIY